LINQKLHHFLPILSIFFRSGDSKIIDNELVSGTTTQIQHTDHEFRKKNQSHPKKIKKNLRKVKSTVVDRNNWTICV